MFVVTLLCIAAALLAMAASAQARTILRGTEDTRVTSKGAKNPAGQVRFLATKLHAQLLRFDLRWAKLEPQRGVYDQTYLDQLAQTAHAATGDGLKIIVTLYGTPQWASDKTLWHYAPPTFKAGVYRSFYPPAASYLPDFQAFATKLATTFGSDVLGYECRNEPNEWFSLYPQRTSADANFGVRRYAAMLTAFSKGIRAGDPDALVIAGSNSPVGLNNDLGTSPQRFATQLKSMVSLSVFDAYSHHPYTTGGTSNTAPEAMPHYPKVTVSLGNISALLKIFPSKPFYITEYGYYTKYRTAMGIYVSQATQAKYLPRAYKYAARFPQIKALIWFPYHDAGPANPPANNGGVYSGAFKLAWYTFSGGNKLTLVTKSLGASARISGQLTSKSMGGLSGKSLVLYQRTPGHAWHVARNLTTGTNGSYHVTVKVSRTTFFKVAWIGVVRSPVLSAK
jgi:Cellulase (glycosyl hydrolase family 5)